MLTFLLTTKKIMAPGLIVLIIVVAVALYVRNRRKTTAGFRKRFGPEYDRAVLEHGSEHKAEAKLAARETRVERLKIRAPTVAECGRYLCRLAASAIPLCRSSEGCRDGGR